jgi:hypothetical protein
MLRCGYLPRDFGQSYTVPLYKASDCRTKSTLCSDYRGISISCILSNIFEHCLLDIFNEFFGTNDNQFGFKKSLSCSHAIYSVKNIVNRFIDGGSTANLCTIDLSKAFDKVNHHALFIKLMKRRIPIKLLDLIVYWSHSLIVSQVLHGTVLYPINLNSISELDKVLYYRLFYLPFTLTI